MLTFIIILLASIGLVILINAEYNKAAKTPGTRIYENKKAYDKIFTK